MTIKPVLWYKKKSDGTKHIKICLIKDRDKDYYSLNIYTYADKIGSDYMQWIDGRVSNAIHINLKIKEALDKFQLLYLQNPNISIKEIKELYDSEPINDFYEFYENQLDLQKKKISKSTIKTYGQLKESLKSFSPKLGFEKIDYEFLSRYEGFLKESGLRQTTVYKRMKIFKMYVNEAFKMGRIKANPFQSYKLKDGTSNRTFLDKVSLQKIVDCDKLNKYEDEVRKKFLFQCYTGLSFSDLISLRWSEIRDNAIYRERIKTKEPIIIPLIPEAQQILKNQKKEGEYIFSKISNQKYNEFLHCIEDRLEFSIPLTSHVARHTFATLALDSGVSIAVVSSVLGHSNIRTTQIYAKITKRLKVEEMQKLRF